MTDASASPMSLAPPAPPCTLVVFGAAGDLTRRLLVPALYNMACAGLLPERFAVIGISREEKSDDAFRRDLEQSRREFAGAPLADDRWRWLSQRLYYLSGDFTQPQTYERLAQLIPTVDTAHGTGGSALFYLATPPGFFATIITRLGAAGLVRQEHSRWRRVVVEKPFGTDLPSAQALNREILGVLEESQIYRIDHYLGKETVQNIMVLRFANGIFEPLWNRNHIDHVQITVAETVSVERRGKFYDTTGALRDMVPNHLFTVLSLIAMEPPTCFDADAVRSEKTKVLEAIHRFSPEDARRNVVRGQYGDGTVRGRPVKAYRDAPNVDPHSTTETYVALRLLVDNWRWANTPFYIRTGKALAIQRTEVVIRFKRPPLTLFRGTPVESLAPNDLVLHIQPGEGVSWRFSAKFPGPSLRTSGVDMRFNYVDYFKAAPNTGYETLIYDCMIGDATLFKQANNIEAGWAAVQPVLDAWDEDRVSKLPIYSAGSAGPQEAEALLLREGRRWCALS
jgi:glucose-6-phosphate 1-dehydrogenase